MLVQESTDSYAYELQVASNTVLKQHFKLVQFHLKPSFCPVFSNDQARERDGMTVFN